MKIGAFVAAMLAALVVVPFAAAGPIVDRADESLANDPVYVDPSAQLAKRVDEQRVQQEVESAGAGPVCAPTTRWPPGSPGAPGGPCGGVAACGRPPPTARTSARYSWADVQER